ncbi:MAG: hypothetical protein R2798_03255 [Chitinophagales bacterium]|nr:hypothetical protein [Chitinophagales bacterium]
MNENSLFLLVAQYLSVAYVVISGLITVLYFFCIKLNYLQDRRISDLFFILMAISFVNSLIIEVINEIFPHDPGKYTIIVNLYNLYELVIYGIFFYRILENLKERKATKYIFSIFLITNVLNYFFYEGIMVFNSLALSLNCIVYITFAILYFRQILQNPVTLHLEKYPIFWLVAAIFFYHSASLFISLFQKFIYLGYFAASFPIWNLYNIFVILYELLIGYALLLWIPHKTSPS